MKAWTRPAFHQWFWHLLAAEWCGGYFLIFLGPLLPNERRLNAKAYLSIFAEHVHPSISTVDHLLMANFSRGWCCGALLDVVKREICIINVQQAGAKCT